MKILLERSDVNPDMADLAGETALSQALDREHYAIAKLLSEHRNFILQLHDKGATTPSPPWRSGPDQGHPKESADFDVQSETTYTSVLLELPSNQS